MKRPANIMDEAVPKIGVKPLAPRKYLNEFIKRNFNAVADWILNLTPEIVKKILPTKIQNLIDLSKKSTYLSHPKEPSKKIQINGVEHGLVKWCGYSDKYNQWLPVKEFEKLL